MICSFIAAMLYASVKAYSVCDPQSYPYAKTNNAPIRLVQNQQHPTGPGVNPNFTVTVEGFIQITGQCTFAVVNFTYSGVGIDDTAVWYGGFTNSAAVAVSLTDNVPVLSNRNRTNIGYSFTTAAGKQISYQDFNEFRLFTLKNNMLLARAAIPNSPVGPPAGTSRTTSRTTTIVPAVRPVVTQVTTPTGKPGAGGQPQQPVINLSSRSSLDPWVLVLAFLCSFIFMN